MLNKYGVVLIITTYTHWFDKSFFTINSFLFAETHTQHWFFLYFFMQLIIDKLVAPSGHSQHAKLWKKTWFTSQLKHSRHIFFSLRIYFSLTWCVDQILIHTSMYYKQRREMLTVQQCLYRFTGCFEASNVK